MKALIKTLFGDAHNVAGVAIVGAVALALIATHHASLAPYAVPLITLAVVGWLARS